MAEAETEARAAVDDRRWAPLWVLAVGLVSVAVLIAADHLRHRTVVRDAHRLQAMGEIQVSVAVAHLWLEEFVSGDEVEVEEIHESIARALFLIDALLGAAPAGEGSPPLAIEDAELLGQAAAIKVLITEFRAIAAERQLGFERALPVGIGSALDVEYDRVFTRLLRQAGALERALDARMLRRHERSRMAFLAIVAGWSVAVAFAAAALWRRERFRRRTEEVLRLSQEQLLQAQKLEAMGRLAGGLAHDINNYLAAIRSHCELVRMKQPPGDRTARKMDAVIRTVEKASALIDRLLTFSRRQPMELEVVDLNQVIDGLVKVVRPSLGEQVRLRTRLQAGLWPVEVDLAQIEQVLVNLLVNARDAMPEGGEVVIVTANRRLPPRSTSGVVPGSGAALPEEPEQVLIAVTDTGHGIPPEVRDKIFEPFWTTKAKGKSGGLGLATVYGIVQRHRGRIEVASEVGRGTTFEIYLPRSTKPLSALGSPGVSSIARIGGSERILLVDDSPDFRDATRALLEVLGYQVTTASDGEEALARLEDADGGFDLVLTDVVMPRLSGPEMVARMRRDREIPVLFISGHADEVMLRHGMELGDVHFMKKQVSATRLARKIRELLDSSQESVRKGSG